MGAVTISDYTGPYPDIVGSLPAWAYIGEDDYGETFAIYVEGFYEDDSPIVGYYITREEESFYPIAEGSLIFDTSVLEGEELDYSTVLYEGHISGTDDYADDNETFKFSYDFVEYLGDFTEFEDSDMNGIYDLAIDENGSIVPASSDDNLLPIFTADEVRAIHEDYICPLLEDDDTREAATYDDFVNWMGGVDAQVIYDDAGEYLEHRWYTLDDYMEYVVQFIDSEEFVGVMRYGLEYIESADI